MHLQGDIVFGFIMLEQRANAVNFDVRPIGLLQNVCQRNNPHTNAEILVRLIRYLLRYSVGYANFCPVLCPGCCKNFNFCPRNLRIYSSDVHYNVVSSVPLLMRAFL